MSVAEVAELVAFARAALEAGAGLLTVSTHGCPLAAVSSVPTPQPSLFPPPCSVPWALGQC